MQRITTILIIFFTTAMILAYKDIERYIPITIEGVVLDAETKRPLSNLHVFTKKGEEEALTNEAGEFRFKSWQKLPFVVTVQEPGGREKQIKVDATPVKLTILFP